LGDEIYQDLLTPATILHINQTFSFHFYCIYFLSFLILTSPSLPAFTFEIKTQTPIYLSMAVEPLWTLAAFSVSLSVQSVGLLGRGISPPQGRYLHRTTQM
jgi:hypothetical protein